MKTLAVLSALAAVVFSAPTLPEAGQETRQTNPLEEVSLLATGKSASPQTFNSAALHEIGNASPLQLDASHEPSARFHLGHKKPIIIKKKLGASHLYRSSGEEQAQADPQETCMQEVKVKLCDAVKMTTTDKARSTIIEDADTHTTDSDVEHSIKMAKEAVENLQRGLLNMEHKPDAKMSQWKHSNLESDVEMHQDIEVARQALEHFQQNFGNLESMNLRAATLKDTEHLHNSHVKTLESEEARLAQWKEAIDNIQKNVEIAKNLEDSFKAVAHDITPSHSETLMKTTDEKPDLLQKNQGLHQHDADMRFSASSPVEVKIIPDSIVSSLEKKDAVATEELGKSSATEENVIVDTNIAKEKSTELVGDMESKNKKTVLKSVDKSEEMRDSETALKLSEKSANLIDTESAQSILLSKSANNFEKDLEHISAKKLAIEQEKSASAWEEPVETTLLAKVAEHVESDTTKLMNSSDQVEKKQGHELNTTDESAIMQKIHQFSIGKSAESLKKTEHPDSTSTMKSADHVVEQNTQEKRLSHLEPLKENSVKHEALTVKAAEEAPILLLTKSADSGSSMHPSAHVEVMTSDFPINHPMGKSVHLDSNMAPSIQTETKTSDHHIFHSMGKSVHLDSSMASSTQTEIMAADHHILPSTGKSAFLDSKLQPQMEKNAVEGKSAMEQNKMMQWKQINGARSAYGLGGYGSGAGGAGAGAVSAGLGGGYGANAAGMDAGASGLGGYSVASAGGHGGYGSSGGASAGAASGSGRGAVGVFPNANVGGCAIPLLLSCSPSVVSGKLAKAHHTGYGAPAYRMGEDFKYHFKRDTKKTNEIPTAKVKRTNPKRVEKISVEKNL